MKLTGGQRIDLLGVKKEDLPAVWRDLDMPSGYAYAKSYRTCKSCVGTDFCRFGLGDSISLADEDRARVPGVRQPAQDEARHGGLPAQLLGSDGQGRRRGGGRGRPMGDLRRRRGGLAVRKGDLLCVVNSTKRCCMYTGRFIQYYRENAKYLERTYAFVERLGIDASARSSSTTRRHRGAAGREVAASKAAYRDPWREARASATASSSSRSWGRPDDAHRAPPRQRRAVPVTARAAVRGGERLVAVFHMRGGKVFAVQARCPHRGGPLADGLLGDGRVVCPLHRPRGLPRRPARATSTDEPIATFPARVEGDGTIVVSLPERSAA